MSPSSLTGGRLPVPGGGVCQGVDVSGRKAERLSHLGGAIPITEEDRRRAMEAGFDRHLTKPMDATDLAQSLPRGGMELM